MVLVYVNEVISAVVYSGRYDIVIQDYPGQVLSHLHMLCLFTASS